MIDACLADPALCGWSVPPPQTSEEAAQKGSSGRGSSAQHDYNAPEHQQPPPAHVREVFARFDANGDGVLDATELRAAAAHLGLELDADGAAALLRRHDTDGSGFIDLAELAAVVAHLEELKASRESLEA